MVPLTRGSSSPRPRTTLPCRRARSGRPPRLASAFELFGKRWNAVIIDVLLQRPARFQELGRAIPGLSQRVLSERLGELADADLVERHVETDR